MNLELLMAARLGRLQQLKELLGALDQASNSTYIAVDSSIGNPARPGEASLPFGITPEGDSVLHVLASSGDSQNYLESARWVYDNDRSLLDASNLIGDSPLHCAARACNFMVLSRLICLAKEEQGSTSNEITRVKRVLRKQNQQGETVLHVAIRTANTATVRELMKEDPDLARVVARDITSPLYLAISLGRIDVACLLHEFDTGLSHSGPNGQSSLHAAVLQGKEMTDTVLQWSSQQTQMLTTMADSSGSTPLHFAASADGPVVETARSLLFGSHGFRGKYGASTTSSLLAANLSAAFRPDNNGALPIHVASSVGDLRVVSILIKECLECAGMRDKQGRTFLHVAVEKKRRDIVAFVCGNPSLAGVLNMQDIDGNSALHLAVKAGSQSVFRSLLQNKEVNLNMANNSGQTPLDYSWSRRPAGINYRLDPRTRIHQLLLFANAKNGNCRWDHFDEQNVPKLNEAEESKKLTEASQIVGISSVLVATVTFAASFTMPGGYRGDDHVHGGTPTLAGSYTFNLFVIANTLAFCCSVLATFSLIYSGLASISLYTRFRYFILSIAFLRSSSRSLAVAFALGIYVVLAPVAHGAAIATTVITSLTLVYENRDILQILSDARVLHSRMGFLVWKRFGWTILSNILSAFWSYVVIFSLAAWRRTHHIK